MIVVNRALIPLFFCFCFHDYLLFFTGELPTIRLETMWNSPHKGMLGTIAMIVPLFLSFFCFFDYLLSVYRKTAHNQAMDDRERSPQRYAGHDRNDHALYLFFFLIEYLLFIYRKTAHVQAHDDVELSLPRYARHNRYNTCPFFFF